MKLELTAAKKGSSLVLVILVMLVLSILGAALLNVSVANARHAQVSKGTTQAQLLARSGVDVVADYIIVKKAEPALTLNTPVIVGDGQSYTIKSFQPLSAEDGYLITAEGNDHGFTRQVTLKVAKDKPSDIFDVAVYAHNNLDISRMKVEGDIRSGGTIAYSSNGSDTYDLTRFEPYADSPMDVQYRQLPVLLPASPHQNIGTISITGNSDYSINTAGYTETNPLKIIVDNLTVQQGRLIIEGNGFVELYVNDLEVAVNGSLQIQGTTVVTILIYNKAGDAGRATFLTPVKIGPDVNNQNPNQLAIFLDDNTALDFQANGSLWGYIYGPKADIIMQSEFTAIYGAVIGRVINGNGNTPAGRVIYKLPDDSRSYSFAAYRKRIYK